MQASLKKAPLNVLAFLPVLPFIGQLPATRNEGGGRVMPGNKWTACPFHELKICVYQTLQEATRSVVFEKNGNIFVDTNMKTFACIFHAECTMCCTLSVNVILHLSVCLSLWLCARACMITCFRIYIRSDQWRYMKLICANIHMSIICSINRSIDLLINQTSKRSIIYSVYQTKTRIKSHLNILRLHGARSKARSKAVDWPLVDNNSNNEYVTGDWTDSVLKQFPCSY